MTTLTTLLVGAHFMPPAKGLLECLPSGSPLRLVPEPDNPHDPEAIKVFVSIDAVPEDLRAELDFRLGGFGFTLEDIMAEPEWCLGHVAASDGKPLAKANLTIGTKDILPPLLAGRVTSATLGFLGDGAPTIILEVSDDAA